MYEIPRPSTPVAELLHDVVRGSGAVLHDTTAWDDRPPFALGGVAGATLWRWEPSSGTVARRNG
jgi:hypothetical protein